jgi:hypothetical protein
MKEPLMLREHDLVALGVDLPEYRLRVGDTGTVVSVHPEMRAYTVEFMTFGGDTVGLPTLFEAQVRAVAADEIAQSRPLTAA